MASERLHRGIAVAGIAVLLAAWAAGTGSSEASTTIRIGENDGWILPTHLHLRPGHPLGQLFIDLLSDRV